MTFAIHPANFRPPVQQLITPDAFRSIIEDLAPVVRAVSIRKLRDYGFNDLKLMGDDAPNTLEELKDCMENKPYGDQFPIYHSHCENTFLAKNCSHTVYRAWHDIVHVETHGAFTLAGETDVINAQLRELELYGCKGIECTVVWLDIMGGLLHDYKWGVFPEYTRAFVEACMCKGLRYALSYKW